MKTNTFITLSTATAPEKI